MKLTYLLIISALLNAASSAATIVAGSLTLGFDQTKFAALGLTNINSFDQASSNSKTGTQLLTDPGTTTLWSGIGFGINPTVAPPSPAGRSLQGTSMSYDPLNLTGTVTGQIGIGGASRWTVDPVAGGGVFGLGDYSLTYDATRVAGVYSGWILTNNVSFPALAWDLANVTTTVLGDGFTISGDLFVNTDSGLTFFGFLADTDYGDFSLNASTIPEPSAVMLGALPVLALLTRRRRNA